MRKKPTPITTLRSGKPRPLSKAEEYIIIRDMKAIGKGQKGPLKGTPNDTEAKIPKATPKLPKGWKQK